ncbi:MarR family winged helix-turn-helix transcriptional regulator [Streptomyces sp. 35G-GA-8]|uniref:MarR family winged helix-turn-helix transcriptional regulator n=1 Tax=Streptomyces sp. 35G-GA-8 TaxID=2939434 RepID=UPI00201F8E60|nr:MarR family transcriptional regulator [Streptomyces sp. 35G-GA-8]MCL7377056.1 MarR family transcriptional regulator [Streptomyces sp. 35G-GA-8]
MTPKPTPDADAVRPLTTDEEAVVRSLPRLIYALSRALDADMTREQRMSATEYLTLMHLSEAPDRQLRMSDLADACEMSLSGMTRIAHRLESQGFIRRVQCEQDGRSWRATLTETGFARLEEAWPTHLTAVRRHFLDHLVGMDLRTLAAALRNVAT